MEGRENMGSVRQGMEEWPSLRPKSGQDLDREGSREPKKRHEAAPGV